MATKAKKMTGKDISTEALLNAIGDGSTFAQCAVALGLPADSRALDGALQREKRAGLISFNLGARKWMKNAAPPAPKPKRGARKA